MSYMYVVKAQSDSYSTNALRFDTPEEALVEARSLAGRWLLVESFAVIPSDTAPDTHKYYWSRAAVEKAAVGSIVDC